MNVVQLLAVGNTDGKLLRELSSSIPLALPVRCEVLPVVLDPQSNYHPERQQYHSSEILHCMQGFRTSQTWRLLGVAAVDLYIPILKYVFGEAQLGGPCALISLHRLRQEFYGLDRDDDLLLERLVKEAVHELGHTLNLHHCQDYHCAMASAHAVEWIDVRDNTLCDHCKARVTSRSEIFV